MSKKNYLAVMAAAVALVACSEKEVTTVLPEVEPEMVQFEVTINDGATKISESKNDGLVNDIQVFVFNKYGLLETSATSATKTAKVTCTTGEKKIVALVNADPEQSVTTISELGARTVDLKDCGAENLVMIGKTEVNLTGTDVVVIDVERLAAKVVLNSVQLSLPLQFKNISFEINSVYLVNAAGDRAYLEDNTPSVWYNLGEYDPLASMDLLYEDLSGVTVISGDNPYSTDHFFYTYPNSTDTKTRLVLEALIEGQTYYYPITIDEVKPNNLYTYALTITQFGSDSPDKPLEDGAVNVTVSVSSWNDNAYQYEI